VAAACLVWILWTSSVPRDTVDWRPGESFATQEACDRDATRLRVSNDRRSAALVARLEAEKRLAKDGIEISIITTNYTCYPHTFDPRPKEPR
jgi:hypothetical protein